MDTIILYILGMFWVTSSVYVIYYFNKKFIINYKTIFLSIIAGPFIMLIMKDEPKEEKYPNDYIRQFLSNSDEDSIAEWFNVKKNLTLRKS